MESKAVGFENVFPKSPCHSERHEVPYPYGINEESLNLWAT